MPIHSGQCLDNLDCPFCDNPTKFLWNPDCPFCDNMVRKKTKPCSKCLENKPISAFSKNQAWCKDCVKAYNKKYYEKNQEKCKTQSKTWNDSNPEKVKGYYQKWKKKHPEAYEEHRAEWNENRGLNYLDKINESK